MDSINFSDVILGFFLGVWITLLALNYLARRFLEKIQEKVMQELKDSPADDPKIIGLNLEVDKDVIYCYNSENKEFVCQGTTVDEIRSAFKSRFPGMNAYVAGGDPDLVKKFKLEMKTNESSSSQ